jgi:hypothetical protein
MVSRKLTGVWVFFDFCLLAAGAITLALSIVWKAPNLLLNLVFSDNELTGEPLSRQLFMFLRLIFHLAAGLTLAVAFLVTFVISVAAIVQRNHVTIGLKLLNWALIADAIFVVVIGSFLWFGTLEMRANYHKIYKAQSSATRVRIQDTVCSEPFYAVVPGV